MRELAKILTSLADEAIASLMRNKTYIFQVKLEASGKEVHRQIQRIIFRNSITAELFYLMRRHGRNNSIHSKKRDSVDVNKL